MEDHLTLFVDLLGFSDIVVRHDEVAQERVLALLIAISQLRKEFSDKSDPPSTQARAIRLSPTVTTFSDHIVASYPIGRIVAGDENEAISLAFFDCALMVGRIAAAALIRGFLIRGGLSFGPLYHTSGVVFGPAMIDAYHLESRTAVNARVSVAPALLARFASTPMLKSFIHFDTDGLGCLDFPRFMVSALSPSGDGHAKATSEWFERAHQILKENVETLRDTGQTLAAAKWLWFTRKLLYAMRTTNPEIWKSSGVDISRLSWADDISLFAKS